MHLRRIVVPAIIVALSLLPLLVRALAGGSDSGSLAFAFSGMAVLVFVPIIAGFVARASATSWRFSRLAHLGYYLALTLCEIIVSALVIESEFAASFEMALALLAAVHVAIALVTYKPRASRQGA